MSGRVTDERKCLGLRQQASRREQYGTDSNHAAVLQGGHGTVD